MLIYLFTICDVRNVYSLTNVWESLLNGFEITLSINHRRRLDIYKSCYSCGRISVNLLKCINSIIAVCSKCHPVNKYLILNIPWSVQTLYDRHIFILFRLDSDGSTDMFCHMMPFYSYDVPHTCGPDPAVCCQFDFKRLPGGKISCPWRRAPQVITAANVAERWLLDCFELIKIQRYRRIYQIECFFLCF